MARHLIIRHKGTGYAFVYNVAALTDRRGGHVPQDSTKKLYGVKVESGGIVEMHCDMNKRELRFSINGIDYGVAYTNIERTEYRAAVALYEKDDIVSLLD